MLIGLIVAGLLLWGFCLWCIVQLVKAGSDEPSSDPLASGEPLAAVPGRAESRAGATGGADAGGLPISRAEADGDPAVMVDQISRQARMRIVKQRIS